MLRYLEHSPAYAVSVEDISEVYEKQVHKRSIPIFLSSNIIDSSHIILEQSKEQTISEKPFFNFCKPRGKHRVIV